MVKNPSINAEDIKDASSIPGLGRSPGGGYSNPLQYSCLENPMNRGAWQATVHGVTNSWTGLTGLSMHALQGPSSQMPTKDQTHKQIFLRLDLRIG